MKLIYNAFIGNFNSGLIEEYNVFNHTRFIQGCQEAYVNYSDDFEKFSEEIKFKLMYNFGYKCEYEVIISHWPPCENKDRFQDRKIDVYTQVMLNWDIFIKYLWDNREALSTQKFKDINDEEWSRSDQKLYEEDFD